MTGDLPENSKQPRGDLANGIRQIIQEIDNEPHITLLVDQHHILQKYRARLSALLPEYDNK
ncbi:hypothetical protein [Nisaea nitritireducens]|uniref:hypothetical protein n=1 Tax=Nisaea nitritireducens TaxID=568392 RepID=UPI001865ED90|nr:hypothetical protein [Nisaea nitritireducens]